MVDEICHVEIPILDKAEAKAFYETIFDWVIDFDVIPDYGLVNRENTASIGLIIVSELPTSISGIYIEVEDIESKLATIEQAGGEVVSTKRQITPEIGFQAEFKDCFGNKLGLFSRT